MLAAGGKLSASFRAKHIGCPQGVGEARQIGSLVEKFDPDQATAFGQRQLGKAWPMVEGHMGVGLGGIGPLLQSPLQQKGLRQLRPEHSARPLVDPSV
jgi:hypothetical protein